MTRPKLTAITGGIGSGKSVVSHMLRVMGYPVYDCDSRARLLMDTDAEILRRIGREVHPEAIAPDGTIDRQRLSAMVFADKDKLLSLNNIVHSAVATDLSRWHTSARSPHVFVETAILNTSGLWEAVDDAWLVDAPKSLRVSRVMHRNGLNASQVEARMASQVADAIPLAPYFKICNDGSHPVLPRILELLGEPHD